MDISSATPGSIQHHGSDEVFRSLADLTRRKILQLLLVDELNVSQLVTILRLPQSTISRHLKSLRDCGLVRDRRLGTTICYQTNLQSLPRGDVREVVLGWLGAQPLAKSLRERLDRALRVQSGDSVEFFEHLGKKWDELRTAAFGEAFATEAFVSLLPRDWTVADIGTGTGYLLPILAESFEKVIAVEPSANMLECARQRVSQKGLTNVSFHQGDFGQLPIADGCCDLAIACLVLHHVADPAAALTELRRILKPDGVMLIVEQHAHENQRFYDAMRDLWWGFDPQDLAARVETAGLMVLSRRDLSQSLDEQREMEAPNLFVITARRAMESHGRGPKP